MTQPRFVAFTNFESFLIHFRFPTYSIRHCILAAPPRAACEKRMINSTLIQQSVTQQDVWLYEVRLTAAIQPSRYSGCR